MSMLISQADELRALAGGLRKIYRSGTNLTRAQVAGLATAVEAMREAADTIESLREKLQGGTCEWILEHSGTLYDKWRCSKCGYLYVDSRTDGGATDFDPRFCPECGRKVKR